MGLQMASDKAISKMCDPGYCEECVYICEGDFICTEDSLDHPVLVKDDWVETDNYHWCARHKKQDLSRKEACLGEASQERGC